MGVPKESAEFSFRDVEELRASRKYAEYISGLVTRGIVPIVVSKNIYHDISVRDFALSRAKQYLIFDYHLDANSDALAWDSFVKHAMIKGIFRKDDFFAFGIGEVLARELASAKKADDMSAWSRSTLSLFRRDHLFTYAEESRFRRAIPLLDGYFLSLDMDVLWKFSDLEPLLDALLSARVPRFIEVFSDKSGVDMANVMHFIQSKLSALGAPFCLVFVNIAQLQRSE